jgi:hypothetical protein
MAALKQHVHFNSEEANAGSAPVVYTPLHGVGAPELLEAFKVDRAGSLVISSLAFCLCHTLLLFLSFIA